MSANHSSEENRATVGKTVYALKSTHHMHDNLENKNGTATVSLHTSEGDAARAMHVLFDARRLNEMYDTAMKAKGEPSRVKGKPLQDLESDVITCEVNSAGDPTSVWAGNHDGEYEKHFIVASAC
jgi:hypothetical protein